MIRRQNTIGVASRQRGFTMLEVLITTVIFAIGVLGVGGLQLYAIKNTHSSNERVQAALHAYSIADSMRANPDAARDGHYIITEEFVFPNPLPDCVGIDKNCTPEDLAAFDLYHWKQDLNDFNAAGNGLITTVINATGRVGVSVAVSWYDPLTTNEERSVFTIQAEL